VVELAGFALFPTLVAYVAGWVARTYYDEGNRRAVPAGLAIAWATATLWLTQPGGRLMSKIRSRFPFISLTLATLVTGADPAQSVGFEIERITNNAVYDSSPRLGENGLVVWTQQVGSYEIMSHQGGETTQITDNDFDDLRPVAAGGRMLWSSGSSGHIGTGGLSMWDGEQIIEAVPYGDFWSKSGHRYGVDGDRVYYTEPADTGSGVDVFYPDAGETVALGTDFVLGIAGHLVTAWQEKSYGTRLTDLPLGYGINYAPEHYSPPRGGDILLYDINTHTSENLTSDQGPAFGASISGGNVAWYAWDGNDLEVFFLKDGVVTQLTDNSIEDRGVIVWDNTLVWMAWDGSDYEVFHYDGSDVSQVTRNARHDYVGDFRGDAIVFMGQAEDEWGEIYVAHVVPESPMTPRRTPATMASTTSVFVTASWISAPTDLATPAASIPPGSPRTLSVRTESTTTPTRTGWSTSMGDSRSWDPATLSSRPRIRSVTRRGITTRGAASVPSWPCFCRR
jgi:hypothetical protein